MLPVRHYEALPLLGQHTESVLKEYLSLDESQIAHLRTAGVI